MVYINRNPDGTIQGVFSQKQYKDQEKVSDKDPEVIAFQNRPIPEGTGILHGWKSKDKLMADLLAAKKLEDIIPTLVTIFFTGKPSDG